MLVFSRAIQTPISTSLLRRASRGAGDEELLVKMDEPAGVADWSSDGRSVLYVQYAPEISHLHDLSILPLDGDKKPRLFLQTPFDEKAARFSPNGRWVAYTSNQSGRFEIYIRPLSPSAAQWQISKDGGMRPRWRRDVKELFYLAPDGKMMAVPI